MTFIASVIARNGVAIIADSLVTTTKAVIEFQDFVNLITASPGGNPTLKADEVMKLFHHKPHHTEDYEEKLFEYDDYTAITTAGSSIVNGKRIGGIIQEIIAKNKAESGYSRRGIKRKVKEFSEYIEQEVRGHLTNNTNIGQTRFIVTHYDHKNKDVQIFKVMIRAASKKDLADPKYSFVQTHPAQAYEKVVCSGQNRLSDRILLGDFPVIYNLVPKIATLVAADFGVDGGKITDTYVTDLRKRITNGLDTDMKIAKLRELSLQQAVDFAALLMRIEIDLQSYTEDIPTVGGVIKLAVINKNGFEFIAGDEIGKPNNI